MAGRHSAGSVTVKMAMRELSQGVPSAFSMANQHSWPSTAMRPGPRASTDRGSVSAPSMDPSRQEGMARARGYPAGKAVDWIESFIPEKGW